MRVSTTIVALVIFALCAGSVQARRSAHADLAAFERDLATWQTEQGIKGKGTETAEDTAGLHDSYLATRSQSKYGFKDYTCHIGLKKDAASGPVDVTCLAHCRLGSPNKATGTVKPGETVHLKIKRCKSGRSRTEIKFDNRAMMAVSIEDKADYCVTRYRYNRLIQGYQTTGTDKPCSRPDPLANKRPEGALPDNIHELVKKFAPTFHFHPDEKYMPQDIESYLPHTEVAYFTESSSRKGGKKVTVLERGKVNIKSLALAAKKDDNLGRDWFLLQAKAVNKGNLKSAKCYVTAQEVIDTGVVDLAYTVFYPYNAPGSKWTLGMGVHTGDWEHLTVRLDKKSGRILGVRFSAHGTAETLWMLNQVPGFPKSDDGNSGYILKDGARPQAWVGKGTHASINRPRKVKRRYGPKPVRLVPELAKGGGPSLDCSQHYQLVVDHVNKKDPKVARDLITKEALGDKEYNKLVEMSEFMWFTGRYGGPTGPKEWFAHKKTWRRRLEFPRKLYNKITKEWRGNGSSALSVKGYVKGVEDCWPLKLKKGEDDPTREDCPGYHN
eukprot:TRINITY_DN4610_c0_g1_i1.p1 TRINITY_DN4610_c0_g1~~TRINITY_DN4610_c0_g1_i1.p1  ORF type:complete len:553 (+),score=147.58 TRINITY_DN4610_c0_g1_i1:54-1712(+)